jgi:hypothetical protein
MVITQDWNSKIEACRPGQASSYIADDDSVSIMFLPCGVVSFDRSDVGERYCARCNRFIIRNFELEHARR